jgi:hypothetical protein
MVCICGYNGTCAYCTRDHDNTPVKSRGTRVHDEIPVKSRETRRKRDRLCGTSHNGQDIDGYSRRAMTTCIDINVTITQYLCEKLETPSSRSLINLIGKHWYSLSFRSYIHQMFETDALFHTKFNMIYLTEARKHEIDSIIKETKYFPVLRFICDINSK